MQLRWATVATVYMGREDGKGAAVPLSRSELGPSFAQCSLGRGLLPYQLASSPIQQYGHNRHGPKTGGCGLPPYQVAS